MRRLLLSLLTVVFVAPIQAGIWDELEGQWMGTGEVRGMAAEIDLAFRLTLEGHGRHLVFRNRMRGNDGTTWTFSAEALYLCKSNEACSGHWYDSRGTVLPLVVATQHNRLVVNWGDAATERGRTTYLLDADGGLTVVDEVLGKDGVFGTFGRTVFVRKDVH